MKKFIMTLMASMLLLSSTTYAVETSKSHNPAKQMMTMSKTDAQKMFGEAGTDMHAVTLSQDEMAKTEGEWFFLPFFWKVATAFVIGVGSGVANAPTSANSPTYRGPIRSPGTWRWFR